MGTNCRLDYAFLSQSKLASLSSATRTIAASTRAIWLVHAYSDTVASPTNLTLAIALNAAVRSYAERLEEMDISNRAEGAIKRLMATENSTAK
jgi:hypothetical protein